MSESCANSRSEELTKSDGKIVEADHAAAILGWSELGDVERYDACCGSYSQADDEAANSKLRQVVRSGLKNSSDNKDETGKPDWQLAAISISDESSDNGTNESTSGCERCNKFLFRRGQFVA